VGDDAIGDGHYLLPGAQGVLEGLFHAVDHKQVAIGENIHPDGGA
jgi:hypothetical protein